MHLSTETHLMVSSDMYHLENLVYTYCLLSWIFYKIELLLRYYFARAIMEEMENQLVLLQLFIFVLSFIVLTPPPNYYFYVLILIANSNRYRFK